MEHNPLDLEHHEEETWWDVWKRRVLFFVLIALCVTFAAPTFGSCTGAFDVNAEVAARYQVGDRTIEVSDQDLWKIRGRLGAAQRFILQHSQQYYRWGIPLEDLTDEVVWEHVLANVAAVEAGIHVPKAEVGRRLMEENPDFRLDGVFNDRLYREAIAAVTHEVGHKDVTRALQDALRVQQYRRYVAGPSTVFPSEDAFQRWKQDNLRITAEYVVQPFGPLVEEFAGKEPDDADLQKFVGDKEEYKIPPRRIIETAFVRAVDVTDAQLAKLEEFAFANELVHVQEGDDPTLVLDKELFGRFWQPYTDARRYTADQWSALKRRDPDYQKALEEHEAAVAAWKAKPEEERGPEPVLEAEDPGAAVWAEGTPAGDVLRNFWREFIAREHLGQLVIEHMARRAETETKSFTDLLPEFEPLGVAVAINTEPLTDAAMEEDYPDGLARGNEFVNVVRNYLKGPSGEAAFTPEVHTASIPLTRYESRIEQSGAMVLRLAGYEQSRKRNFAEVRAEALADWRSYQVDKSARDRLAAVAKAVTEGGKTLADAAAEAGLPLRRLREFNTSTRKRRLPALPDEGPVDPGLQELHDSILYENFVYDRYRQLSEVQIGQFLTSGVQVDSRRTEAAYLMQLAGQREPDRIEIDELALQTQKMTLARAGWLADQEGVMGYEALVKRFSLETGLNEKAKKKAEDEESGGETGDGTDES